MNKIIVLASFMFLLFPVWNVSAANSGFTCEKIKDKLTRDSCIKDRTERENAEMAKKQNEPVNSRAKITSKCTLSVGGLAECTFRNTGNAKGSLCEYVILTPKNSDYKPHNFRMATQKYVIEKIAILKQELREKIAIRSGNGKDILEKYTYVLNSENLTISDEPICSGLVEAGDIRQVTDTPFFMGNSLHNSCVNSWAAKSMRWHEDCNFSTVSEAEVILMLEKQ